MSDYIYPLDLPSIEDVMLKSMQPKLLQTAKSGLFDQYSTTDVFESSFVKWKNIHWNEVYHFFKNDGWTGPVHSDVGDHMYNCWAINWVHGGNGTMEYWEPHHAGPAQLSKNTYGYDVRYYEPTHPATRKYSMSPGVYLVDTTMPHRASGWNRHVFSLRCTIHDYQVSHPWNKMIDIFGDIIIDRNLEI